MPFSAVVFLRQTLGCLFGACLKGDTNGSGGDADADADADAGADGNDARGQGNTAGDNMEEISLMEHHRQQQQQQQVTRNRDPEIWHMVQLPPLPLNSRFRRGDRNASARRASTRRGLSLDSAVVSSTEKLQSSPDKSSSSSSTDKSSSDDVQNKD